VLLLTSSCTVDTGGGEDAQPPVVTASGRSLRFAVIGDYGIAGDSAGAVAELVRRWKPQLVITTGDNNYPDGAASTIDDNIGQYYHRFIQPYRGRFGIGATRNRFFPSLGNHDWHASHVVPYLDYFTLPGNERYYDFVAGPIHFLALDSDPKEPDGVTGTSAQARWLERRLRASTACWRVVFFHHAPYSSGDKRPGDWMRWPYARWGADVVLSGHEHTYERLVVDGVTYLVVGLGGAGAYKFKDSPAEGSRKRYNAGHGAMLVVAERGRMTFTFAAADGTSIDTHTIEKRCPGRD
jgi:hypothetical protein